MTPRVVHPLVALKEVCELLNGRAYKQPELLNEGKYPVLRVGNFFSNPNWYYSDLELDEDKYCHPGDLLYAWSASFGPKIWGGEKAIYHYHIWRTRLDERLIDKRFLYWWFQWDKENIKAEHGTGSTMIHVTKGDMEERLLALPPLAEQRRIAAKLDALTARTARARADLERIPALASRYRQAVLGAALSGELSREFRESNLAGAAPSRSEIREVRQSRWIELQRQSTEECSSARVRKSRRYKLPVEPRAISSVAPSDWTIASIAEVSEFVTDGEHATPPRDDSGVLLLSARNVRDGHLQFENVDYIPREVHEDICRRVCVRQGDVLLSCSGSVGRSCVFPADLEASFVRSVAIIRPTSVILPEFLSLALRSPQLKDQIRTGTTSTGQPNIFQGKIAELSVPIPTLEEQRLIVRRLGVALAEIDRLTAEAAAARRLLDRLDQAVLAKAFQGELVPQDPADEPAHALLDRIRAEREAAPKAKRGRKVKAAA